jgi:hypothetical protein
VKVSNLTLLFIFKYFWILETKFYYVVQDDLGLVILLPLPLEFWDYRPEPPHLAMLFRVHVVISKRCF